jgi:DNA (cytosine-5)-methyltransferase 1
MSAFAISITSKVTPHLWKYLQDYKKKHESRGNGFGYSLFGPNDVARTLSQRYYKDGSEILIDQPGRPPRRLARNPGS